MQRVLAALGLQVATAVSQVAQSKVGEKTGEKVNQTGINDEAHKEMDRYTLAWRNEEARRFFS